MRSVLVVAHLTLVGDALLHEVRGLMASGPCRFHLLVPVEHPMGAWSDGQVGMFGLSYDAMTQIMAASDAAPAPDAAINGTTPNRKAIEVMRIGRRRIAPASISA